MAKNAQVGEVIVYPAKGGLETISIPGVTPVGSLAAGINFIVDINGAKKKNPGVNRIDDRNNPIAPNGFAKGAFDFWRTTGTSKTRRTTLVASGKVLADSGNGAFTDVTGGFGILSTDNVSMETFFGLLVMAFENNPTSVPLKYDQTGNIAALGGTPPNAKYLRTWQNRLWAAGVGQFPDRLFGSAIDNPEDWVILNGAQQINIDQGDQDPIGITGLFPQYFGRMVVSKRRSLYQITPVSGLFAVSPIIEGIGCVAHNGAVSTDVDIIFPSEQGIHSLAMTDKFGEVESAYLSYKIQQLYQELVAFNMASNMRAIYVPEISSYLLAVTSKADIQNDYIFGYNFALQEWFLWQQNVSAMAKYVDSNDANKTKVLILDDRGRVGTLDTTKSGRNVTWFGDRVIMQLRTGIIYPLGIKKDVTFRELTIFFKPQPVPGSILKVDYLVNGRHIEQLQFEMVANQGALIGFATIGVDVIGSGGVIKQVTKQLKGHGSAIELVMTHEPIRDDDDCEIYGFIIEYEYSGDTDLPRQQ